MKFEPKIARWKRRAWRRKYESTTQRPPG